MRDTGSNSTARDRGQRLVAAAVLIGSLTGCSQVVAGVPHPAPATAVPVQTRAADLLLPEAAQTPIGTVAPIPIGDTYFTSADPAHCSAAILFLGSPLVPAGSTEHAESGYAADSESMMAESVHIYPEPVAPTTVVRDGLTAVQQCTDAAVGISSVGPGDSMQLAGSAVASDGVLVWSMSRPDWTCSYGLAAATRAVLMISVCGPRPGFPMADWAEQRRSQLLGSAS